MSARPAVPLALLALFAAAGAAAATKEPPVIPPSGMTGPAPKAPGKTPSPSPAPKKPEAKKQDGAAVAAVTLTPRAWPRSAYAFDGRLESAIQDVTFDTPPAYTQNFEYWAARMKGTQRTELIQYVTTTRDADESGGVPFRRQVSRYMLDLMEHGQVKSMGGKLNRDVQSLAWEGRLDEKGRIVELKRVAAPEDATEVDRLAFPLLEQILPALDAPRSLKPGESFTIESSLPLPSRLTINGLEDAAARLTRVLTLKEIRGRQAVFDVRASYALDPATPPKTPRTTCTIGGGGDGDAVFDLDAGYFTTSRLTTKMLIDIEAPLRPLPDQPEGVDPGTGKSHLTLSLVLSGKQTATQLFSPAASEVSGGSDRAE